MDKADTSTHAGPASADRPAPTVGELFVGFLGLGMMSFGGALPLARDLVVDRRRWLDATEFNDLLGLCQFLPGGNAINLSVAVGLRFRGGVGAIAALGGLVMVPTLVVIVLGVVYEQFRSDPIVRHAFTGLAAAAAGLLVATAVRVAAALSWRWGAILVAVCVCLAIAWWRWPLLATMVLFTPLSIARTAHQHKAEARRLADGLGQARS